VSCAQAASVKVTPIEPFLETKLLAAGCPDVGADCDDHSEFNGVGAFWCYLSAMTIVTKAPLRCSNVRLGAAIALAATMLATTAWPLAAHDNSGWGRAARSAMRLVAGAPSGEASAKIYRAGIEIKLDPGWKTYWRYPGDSGVPPRFDFSRSENLASVAVLWPAPHAFPDGAGGSIGYTDEVILPLRVVPSEAGKPVVLRLELAYAVCQKLCMPVDAKSELLLDGGPSANEAALAASEARVPKPVAIGAPGPFSIRSASREPSAIERVLVDVVAPERDCVALFAEGPNAEWALPLPRSIFGGPAGAQRFAVELDGLPPGASARGATLKLTAVCRGDAIEAETRLD
jgi:DsbC/DsbD-like thiol-disulfide interchange protein